MVLMLSDSHWIEFKMAVHDCWPPYFSFENARHVLCGAHLLRELAGLMENGSLWAEDMRDLLLVL